MKALRTRFTVAQVVGGLLLFAAAVMRAAGPEDRRGAPGGPVTSPAPALLDSGSDIEGEAAPGATEGDDPGIPAGGPLRSEPSGEELVAVPTGAEILRHVARDGRVIVEAGELKAATGEKLIYSNTGGTLAYWPGRNIRVADDVATIASEPCNLTRYAIKVTGGVPAGTGVFTCKVSLWTDCPPPQGTGTLIPGSEMTFAALSDNAARLHELVVDVSASPVAIPPVLWVRVQFDTPSAGWLVGAPPELGFSGDFYYHSSVGCHAWFGGGSIYSALFVQVFATDSCPTAHVSYASAAATSPWLALGKDVLGADDLILTDPACELGALEVTWHGTSTPRALVDLDLRAPGALLPIPGTARPGVPLIPHSRTEHYTFPPGILLPNPVWLSWKTDQSGAGPVVSTQTVLGANSPLLYRLDPAEPGVWRAFLPLGGAGIIAARVHCRGEVPLGACCPTQGPGEPQECRDGASATDCIGGRWIPGASCASDPSDPTAPPCGTPACCLPDGGCADLSPAECSAITDPFSPAKTCDAQTPCGPGRICQPDGTCAPRTAVTRSGNSCDDLGFTCPVFQCFYSTGECLGEDYDIPCGDPGAPGCPGERVCQAPDAPFCTPRRGCDDLACCNLICSAPGGDPSCCDARWDHHCARLANQLCSVPPTNDHCWDSEAHEGAQPITIDPTTLHGTAYVYNRSATTDYEDQVLLPYLSPLAGTVWYTFTMADTPEDYTTARIHTCGTPDEGTVRDSIIAVFVATDHTTDEAACNSLEPMACNDDNGACANDPHLSELCLSGLQEGATYHILVGTPSASARGYYELDIEIPCPVEPPPNDHCHNAQPLPQDSLPIQVPFDLRGTASDCPGSRCQLTMANDVWFTYTSICDGYSLFETCSPTENEPDPATVLAVYTLSDSPDPCAPVNWSVVTCNDDAPVSAVEHLFRSQTCRFGTGQCDTSAQCPGRRCEDSGAMCSSDTDCHVCSRTLWRCGSDWACRTCEHVNRHCFSDFDCGYRPCVLTQFCRTDGGPCVADTCVSSCGSGSAVRLPTGPGERFLIRIAGEEGAEVGGFLTVRCLEGDCQPNGVPDVDEITAGIVADCNHNMLPDSCEVRDHPSLDCNRNSKPDVCEIDQNSTAPGGPFLCTANCDPDCNGNGRIDRCDATGAADCDQNGIPDVCQIDQDSTAPGGPFFCTSGCEPDCNENGRLDRCDAVAGSDCNANGVPDVCEIDRNSTAPGGPFFCTTNCDPDCNRNGRIDRCDATGASDCDFNRVPDVCQISRDSTAPGGPFFCTSGCEPDCNENGRLDRCDAVAGSDCNANGVPDECEVAEGYPPDCQDNGALDACDIAQGVSRDCNANLVPDECDPPCDDPIVRRDCEIDCTLNGVPDDCDIVMGTLIDCNADQVPDECPRLVAHPSGSNIVFGTAAAMSGTRLLVGAAFESHDARARSGAAYLFRELGDVWTAEAGLFAPDGDSNDAFGAAVDIEGDLLVIGAPYAPGPSATTYTGAAYVFRQEAAGSWLQEFKLVPWGGESGDYFGVAVSLSAGRLAVGASSARCAAGPRCGAVYVFQYTPQGWVLEAQLFAPDGAPSDSFGAAVALDGDMLLVGADGDDFSGTNNAGSVCAFHRTAAGWSLEAQLTAPVPQPGGSFGHSVSLSSDLAVIGAYGTDLTGDADAGAAFAFRRVATGWAFETELSAPDAAAGDHFGVAVAVDARRLLIGAFRDDYVAADSGSAYLFERVGDAWIWRYKLPPGGEPVRRGFGAAVALSGHRAAVLACLWNLVGTNNPGTAHVYDLRPPACACPRGPVSWLDPPAGVIDARLPHAVGDAAQRFGIDTIVVQGPSGAPAGCWSVCETGVAPENAIMEVRDDGGGVYRLKLARPITPGEAITVTYRTEAGGQTATFSAHPGNVDGNSWASAIDIVRFVDCCLNGVCSPRFGRYSCDIDHSGDVTPDDLQRVVDLLHGAGEFRAWYGTRAPAGGCEP
ncbi:MAG: hypothetical protein HY763_08360 [Planctomycetes bacterium]|nr:hypothetical protein [Planctomycetota bacterium]